MVNFRYADLAAIHLLDIKLERAYVTPANDLPSKAQNSRRHELLIALQHNLSTYARWLAMFAPRIFLEDYSPFHKGMPMLFVHTPKCGGKYVSATFHRHMKRCLTLQEPTLAGHLTWSEYKNRLASIGVNINDYTTFSVIRNPFSWHVSWFTYIQGPKGGERSGYHLEHELFRKMSFSNYVDWLSDTQAERTKRFDMGKQVSDWILDEVGNIAVDHVLKQETLVDDLKCMADTYKLRLRAPKNRINVSNENQDYRTFYTSEDTDKIAERHQRDTLLFGYKF